MEYIMFSRSKALSMLGIDHDTAEFAVESIRNCLQDYLKRTYAEIKEILILADGGAVVTEQIIGYRNGHSSN